MKNTDLITTIVGGLGAAVTAAQPVVGAVQGQDMNTQSWLQLAMAVIFGVFGFFTNKKS